MRRSTRYGKMFQYLLLWLRIVINFQIYIENELNFTMKNEKLNNNYSAEKSFEGESCEICLLVRY